MSSFSLLINTLLPHFHLIPTNILIFVDILDHILFAFNFSCLPLINHLLILDSLILDPHGLCLVVISDHLGGNYAIIALGSDS